MKIEYFALGDRMPSKGIYRLQKRDIAGLMARIKDSSPLSVNLTNVGDKTELINSLKSQVPLPEYCGDNWDALEECLRDAVTNALVIISGTSKLRNTNKGSYKTFVTILFETLAQEHLVLLSDEEIAVN
jgi:RNAse (barnase) inhibitor barstar